MESENLATLELDDDLFSKKVTDEQIQQIFKQIPFVVFGPMFGAVITALLLFDYIEPVRIYTWVVLVLISYSSLLFLWALYQKSDTSIENEKIWGDRYLYMSWIAAGSWGSISLFLFSADSFVAQMILAMSVMIGAAALTVGTIVYKPVFYTVILLLAPLFIQFIRAGDEGHYIFALGCIGFTAMLFFIHFSVNQVVEQSIRLRFINYKLASDLNVQKEIAEKSSMAKSSFLAVAS